MSSSISSSEASPGEWARWLATFLGALALGSALVFAFVFVVEPYDSGRFGLLGPGIADGSPRTANASRARDPNYDSAVIGNSTGQLLKPSELSRLTGKRFVQLTIPGTGPREQHAVMDFFIRTHAHIGALVIDTDEGFCLHDPDPPLQHPFPFWLYGESTLDYVGRLFSTRALGSAGRRVLIRLGLRKRSEPDGYWDYEALGPREFQPVITEQPETASASPAIVDENFPAVAQLDAALRKLPADVPVVLFVPPVFYSKLARPGSAAAAEQAACHSALKRLVAGRANSNFIDYRIDNALTRDRANFMDFGHYRAIIARRMEQGIADSIRLGDKASVAF